MGSEDRRQRGVGARRDSSGCGCTIDLDTKSITLRGSTTRVPAPPTRRKSAGMYRPFLLLSLRRPRLWPALLSAAWAFRPKDWYRKPPFLPLPSKAYMRWRLETAYGEPDAVPPADEIARFVTWSAEMRRRMRPRGGVPVAVKVLADRRAHRVHVMGEPAGGRHRGDTGYCCGCGRVSGACCWRRWSAGSTWCGRFRSRPSTRSSSSRASTRCPPWPRSALGMTVRRPPGLSDR